jgi:hypothetical protein
MKNISKEDLLIKKVANVNGAKNSFSQDVFKMFLTDDIEDVAVYLPKDTMTLRLMLEVANIEDVVYMKLIDDSGFSIDKVLRRVDDINKLGLNQDGYVYEPSILKNIVTLQLYIPSIYLYKNIYKPKLVFSFKRNARSIQESINFAFMKERLSVIEDKNGFEKPFYSNVKEYCKHHNKIDAPFNAQLQQINTQRVDEDFITELRSLCK